MLGLIGQAGLWALKFGGKRAIGSPLMTATMAHMATDGKSTDMVLNGIEGAGNLIGKDNTKTAAKAAAGFIGSLTLAWAQMTGKVAERAGGAVVHTVRDKIAAVSETPAASEQTAIPAAKPTASPNTRSSHKEKSEGEKSPFNNAFSMAAGGGFGALLGGMSGNPVIMILGALLAMMMVGNIFAGKDEKAKPHHPAPAP